jgi:threonine 3-dehydrogenase
MLAVRKMQPQRGIEVVEIDQPKPKFDELLLSVRKAGICGSDRHLYEWDAWAELNFPTPVTLGHEIVGEVVSFGSGVQNFSEGDITAVESHVFDGTCRACRTGNAHVCENLRILGIDMDGGFASFVTVPARLAWKVPSGIPLEHAALFEPLGNAVHATMRYDVSGQPLAVYGCGPMGLMAIAVARSIGANPIVASDISEYRRNLARVMGAHATVDASSESCDEEFIRALGSRPTRTLEMSGHPRAVQQALRLSANGGKVVLLGIPPNPVEISIADDVLFRGLDIYGVTGRLIWDTWYRTETFLLQHGKMLDPMLTHTFPLNNFEDAMSTIVRGACGKILLDIDTESSVD